MMGLDLKENLIDMWWIVFALVLICVVEVRSFTPFKKEHFFG